MEKNNDPSTSSGTNKNKNVKELTDEQMKKVAGGGVISMGLGCIMPAPFEDDGCLNFDKFTCKCTQCKEGWVLREQYGKWECVPQ